MLLKEFAERALKLLNQLGDSKHEELDILVKLESGLAFDSLKQNLIAIKESASATDEANELTLNPLIDLFKIRWRSIRLTDANYCHAPNSLASQAYLKVAEELGILLPKELPEVILDRIANDAKMSAAEKKELIKKMRTSPYHYLFPVVKGVDTWSPNSCITSIGEGGLHNLKLNEFIFTNYWKPGDPRLQVLKSSDNKTLAAVYEQNIGEPIEVIKCLSAAAAKQFRVLETTCSSPKRLLEAAEEARISQHSPEAGTINTNLKRNVSITPDEIEKTLKSELARGNYAVRSSYGKEGSDRLLTVIMSRSDNLVTLARVMSGFLSKDEWDSFLREISLDDLRKVVLQKKSYKDAVANPDIYCGDKFYNVALMYSMVYLYKAERSLQSNHTTNYGRIFYAYTRQEKLAAADILLAYLSSDLTLSLDKFLPTIPMPAGVDRKRLEGAIFDGDLGYITKAITKRTDLLEEPESLHGLYYIRK